MNLSEDQTGAIAAILSWWRDSDRQTFVLAGYAGTGKTTVISHLIAELGEHVTVGAPTGKAALRLREKGVRASTIHQLAYRHEGNDADGNPEFSWKGISGRSLVIIDEASMVNQEIYDDLIRGGYRMLFVGDHGQLAPVGGDPGIMRAPDYTLQVIHRTDDTGLLEFAHALREGKYLPEARGSVRVLRPHPILDGDHAIATAAACDVVLCYQNRTRHWLNARIMAALEICSPWQPTADGRAQRVVLDAIVGRPVRVVGLMNNYRLGIHNGELLTMTVESVHDSFVFADVELDTGARMSGVTIATSGFAGTPDRDLPKEVLLADFGYALTVHKSQGSEWDHVCMWDDTFRDMRDRQRLCYTAATRAKRRLTWIAR